MAVAHLTEPLPTSVTTWLAPPGAEDMIKALSRPLPVSATRSVLAPERKSSPLGALNLAAVRAAPSEKPPGRVGSPAT